MYIAREFAASFPVLSQNGLRRDWAASYISSRVASGYHNGRSRAPRLSVLRPDGILNEPALGTAAAIRINRRWARTSSTPPWPAANVRISIYYDKSSPRTRSNNPSIRYITGLPYLKLRFPRDRGQVSRKQPLTLCTSHKESVAKTDDLRRADRTVYRVYPKVINSSGTEFS